MWRTVRLVRVLWAMAAAVLVLGLTSCGGSSGSGTTNSSASGSIAGYVFVPTAGGAPTVSPAPVSPPAGSVAASGATVVFLGTSATGRTLGGGGQSTTADSTGHFQLSGVPGGLGQITVTASGGASATVSVTVIDNATVSVGQPAVTRAAALTKAQAGVPAGTDTRSLFILSPQEPLPTGVQITEALGNANGDQDQTTAFTTTSSQWFFYVDPSAEQKFQHAVQYVFVDAATGAVTTHAATSFPLINGQNLYEHPTTNHSSADLALAPTKSRPAASGAETALDRIRAGADAASRATAADGRLQSRDNCPNPHTYALLVQGEDDDSMAADITKIQTMFGNNGLPASISTTIVKPSSQSPRADFKAALATIIKNAGPCDTIFVYVTAHGNENGSIPLARSRADGTPNPTDDKLVASDFNFSGANVANCTVILDTCYSGVTGSAIAQLNAGSGLVIATATDRTHNAVACGSWDFRAPTGGIFTTEFVNAFNRLSGYTQYLQAFNVAFNATAITLANYTILLRSVSSMNPQIFFASSFTKAAAADRSVPSRGRLSAAMRLASAVCGG